MSLGDCWKRDDVIIQKRETIDVEYQTLLQIPKSRDRSLVGPCSVQLGSYFWALARSPPCLLAPSRARPLARPLARSLPPSHARPSLARSLALSLARPLAHSPLAERKPGGRPAPKVQRGLGAGHAFSGQHNPRFRIADRNNAYYQTGT